MKRVARIAIEFLGPPLLAATIGLVFLNPTFLFDMAFGGSREPMSIAGVAAMLAAVPSLVYVVVMEVAFSRGLYPRSFGALALSAGLGAVSGAAIGGFAYWGALSHGPAPLLFFVPLSAGLLIGLLMGVAIWLLSPRQAQPVGTANSGIRHESCS